MPGPEIDAVITMLRESPPFGGDDINTMRAGMREATAAMPLPEDVRFERIEAGRTAVPAEWAIAPNARDDRVVVYLHGGGYVMGGVDTHRGLVADLSRAASARVLSVDYRLAPENPHPAAVEDAASGGTLSMSRSSGERALPHAKNASRPRRDDAPNDMGVRAALTARRETSRRRTKASRPRTEDARETNRRGDAAARMPFHSARRERSPFRPRRGRCRSL